MGTIKAINGVDLAGTWLPTDAGAQVWLDASDASTITIDTGVSVWADKSGNGYDATQATPGYQPSYSSEDGELFFAFAPDQSLAIPLAAAPTLNRMVLFVCRNIGGDASGGFISYGGGSSNPEARLPTGSRSVNVYWNGAYVISVAMSAGFTSEGIHAHYTVGVPGETLYDYERLNGAEFATGNRVGTWSAFSYFAIGRFGVYNVGGYIKELMVLPYSAENLANAEAYLAAKHGIALA